MQTDVRRCTRMFKPASERPAENQTPARKAAGDAIPHAQPRHGHAPDAPPRMPSQHGANLELPRLPLRARDGRPRRIRDHIGDGVHSRLQPTPTRAQNAPELDGLTQAQEVIVGQILRVGDRSQRKFVMVVDAPCATLDMALNPHTGTGKPATDIAGCNTEARAYIGNGMPVFADGVVELEPRRDAEAVDARGNALLEQILRIEVEESRIVLSGLPVFVWVSLRDFKGAGACM
jgi:hypothetical protein